MKVHLFIPLVLLMASQPLIAGESRDSEKERHAVSGWSLWPKASDSLLKNGQLDQTPVTHLLNRQSNSIYRYLSVESGGLYEVTFRYQFKGGGSPAVSFSFKNEKGSAIPVDSMIGREDRDEKGWVTVERSFVVPKGVTKCQLIISVAGRDDEMWLGEVILKREEATAIRKGGSESPNADFWEGVPALSSFWQIGGQTGQAVAQTKVKMTYDEKNLYLLFINEEPSLSNMQGALLPDDGRDQRVWNDDSNEVYLVSSSGEARQFVANIKGAQWDGGIRQAMAGDPYRADSAWNGYWRSSASVGNGEWHNLFIIPFADLGESPVAGTLWRVNLSRHRYAGHAPEHTRWNHYDGANQALDQYATLVFGDEGGTLARNVEVFETSPLTIVRERPEYSSVLTAEPGGYLTGDWGSDFFLDRHPKSWQEKYTREQWLEVLKEKLAERGRANSYAFFVPTGPNASNWALFDEAHARFGLKYPYWMTTSGLDAIALKDNARYHNAQPFGVAKARVSEFDPAKKRALIAGAEAFFKANAGRLSSLLCFDVVDEPTNNMFGAFSRTRRPDAKEVLDSVEEEIRQKFGNESIALWDFGQPEGENSPLERIAFARWWNFKMEEWGREVSAYLKERAPEIPVCLSNQNTVGNIPFIDVPLLSTDTDWLSLDPYPTAVMALSGRARALYHTGFATKWLHDLGGRKPTRTILQAFTYHDRSPSRGEVREWASQAIKNGASILSWYTMGPSPVTLPEVWDEVLKINTQVKAMNRVRLPDTTSTVIYHSFISQSGLNDHYLHPHYTLYTLLGERLGSWFRFVGDTDPEAEALANARLIYLPQAAYLTKQSAERLLKEVRRGATLVVLDPLAFQSDEHGTPLASVRDALLGGRLGEAREANRLSVVAGGLPEMPEALQLPLTPIGSGIYRGRILARNLAAPEDATIFARYEDGLPAAYSRKVGEGRVIYFGAQPYGDSELAIIDSPWISFHQKLAEKIGEPLSLPIWNFYLKSVGESQ